MTRRDKAMRALLVAGAIFVAGAALAQEKPNVEALLKQAAELEAKGDGRAAVKVYVTAARAGSAVAGRRLAQIHESGMFGIERNDVEALKWHNFVRMLGEKSHGGWGCPPNC
jgi:TPR repeat protein